MRVEGRQGKRTFFFFFLGGGRRDGIENLRGKLKRCSRVGKVKRGRQADMETGRWKKETEKKAEQDGFRRI